MQGWGSHGLLGHGGDTNEKEPRVVAHLAGKSVSAVRCGWAHTLVILADGSVLAMGYSSSSSSIMMIIYVFFILRFFYLP